MAINKIIYDGTTLIDLTSDTVSVSDVVSGVTFHLRDGTSGTGTLANGNSIGYGNTDRTAPIVGVGQVGYAEL